MSQPCWEAGAQVTYREVWRGKVWTAMPVTVVRDTPDLVVLYLSPGTRWKLPQGGDFLALLRAGDWRLRDVTAAGGCLFLIPPGEAHAVRTLGGLGRDLTGWYVNLQEPVRRTALGFDTMDHALDIVVAPDLSGWSWRDELERAQELGLFPAGLVRRIRAEGERIVRRIAAGSYTLTGGWDGWRSPVEWPVPDLPDCTSWLCVLCAFVSLW